MLSSFSSALSALKAHNTAIDVVGNNLANLNTPGFKTSTVAFHDLLARSIGSGAETGVGVGPMRTVRQFSQGSVQPTGRPLDAAIEGNGFFVVENEAGKRLYTRAGNFVLDQDGVMRTLTGEMVQGWSADNNGVVNTSAAVGRLQITESLLRPVATTGLSLGMNLNSEAPVGETTATPVEIFDSLGNSFVVNVTLTKTAANQWDYVATVPGSAVGSPEATVEVMNSSTDPAGPLEFGPDGLLTSPSATDPAPQIVIPGLGNGAADMTVTWQVLDRNGRSTISQFASKTATSFIAQNGTEASQMTGLRIAEDGRIVADFANREETVVGVLALAHVRNPNTLTSVGNNNLEATIDTAVPAIGAVNTGGRGQIIGGALELSNVDLAAELTNLIIYQRGYQANTRVITTSDEISQETIGLKR